MKDTARLLAYLAGTVVIGALSAPPLYWAARGLASSYSLFGGLARYDFETFFHRALLIAALALLWPLLRGLKVRSARDLRLEPNPSWARDAGLGILIAAVPLLLGAIALVALRLYSTRSSVAWANVGSVALASITVPFIEETLFRGLILGILLRARGAVFATIASAAFFSVVHFLKAPEGTSAAPVWYSGFVSIAHSFDQFRDPMLVLAGFTTLFILGCILAHARIATRSLWLPIGLHAGWIFTAGEFNKFTRRQALALPWLGKNLLVGLVPLGIALVSWALLVAWFRYARPRTA